MQLKFIYVIGGSSGFVLGLFVFFTANTIVQQINVESGHHLRSLGFYDYAALSGIPISLASIPVIIRGIISKFKISLMTASSAVIVLIWFGVLFSVGS